ncbi:hypothetical protein AVEN_251487-1 [Araneus ventricosus]|uniref:Uncharacterized protein n=1 Tax=Araneus ventricosus TaxID=182803 RepID=A0A4Y2K344_ARAVE|nr:hypothetical protein AVEN_251487-1 [Araneus ventricosus]
MASSFSRPAGRKKSPQGATGPSTLNVPKEESNPRKRTFSRIKMARNCQLVGQNRKQLGIPCHLPNSLSVGKRFLWTLFAAVTFSQINKAINLPWERTSLGSNHVFS